MAQVKVYVKDWCPYCQGALQLLKSKGVEAEVISVDGNQQLYSQLKQKTGHQTVPQIFINDEFIGGYDELRSLERQQLLDEKLK